MTLRHRHRQQRERDERKREKQITEEENKRMGRYPTPAVHIDSRRHFPRWQPELFSEYIYLHNTLSYAMIHSICLQGKCSVTIRIYGGFKRS